MREVVDRKEIDEDFAALVFLFDAHARAQGLGELALEEQELRREIRLARPLGSDAARNLLGIAHGEALGEYFLEEGHLLGRAVHEHKERSRMPFANLARRQGVAHFLRKQENAEDRKSTR